MLGVHFGSDAAYFGRHVADAQRAAGKRGVKQDYYSRAVEAGEPPGEWLGRGIERLGLSGEVTDHQMKVVYGALANPTTGEVLGTALRHYASPGENLAKVAQKRGVQLPPELSPEVVREAIAAKTMLDRDVENGLGLLVHPEELAEMKREAASNQRQARKFVDVTCSPDKTWSVLHAAAEASGDIETVAAIEAAHREAKAAVIDVLTREAGLARAGYHGKKVGGRTAGRWIGASELVIADFFHHLSREGDPQLHSHLAILNRAYCEDGQWRALDGSAVMRARLMAAAVFERTGEESLSKSLGLRFITSPDGKSRRIEGIDQETIDLFSKRTQVINSRVEQWVEAYKASHGGDEPNERQVDAATQQICLSTRKAKPAEMDARPDTLARWDAELTESRSEGLEGVLKSVKKAAADYQKELGRKPLGPIDPVVVADQAIAEVGRIRAKWTRYDLAMEINRALPDDLGGLSGAQVDGFLQDLTEGALKRATVACLTAPDPVGEVPAELCRSSDGRSIYSPRDDVLYALDETLSREQRLLSRALEHKAPAMAADVAEKRLAKTGLRADQADAVRACLTSGRSLEVLIGPAGAGKSYSVTTLAHQWVRHVGRGSVVGLTVSENAANVLKDEGLDVSSNIVRWLGAQERLAVGKGRKADAEFALSPGCLVIVDEASMVPTEHLARIGDLVAAAGGKVLLAGDDRQLGGIESAGVMGLIANDAEVRRAGAVHELSEVVRFEARWEREASLRLRDGDAEVLNVYARHGRIDAGDERAMVGAAYEAFVTDILAGKRSLLIAPTAAQAAELSTRVRDELVQLGRVSNDRTAVLGDQCLVGVGDIIQCRRNDRLIRHSDGRPVSNRDVFLVEMVMRNRSLVVRRDLGRNKAGEQLWGKAFQIDSDYTAEHVQLAYASTIHAAQGRTVDTSHGLVDDRGSREALYVTATRGRFGNRLYVVTEVRDTESLDEPAVVERDALDVLGLVLERSSATLSATEEMRDQFDAAESLARLGPIWSDVCGRIEAKRHSAVLLEALGGLEPQSEADRAAWEAQGLSGIVERVQKDAAYPGLMRIVAAAHDEGHDTTEMLRSVVNERELLTAESVAEVLHWRVERYLETTSAPGRSVEGQHAERVESEQVIEAMSSQRRASLRADPALPALVALVAFGEEHGQEAAAVMAKAEALRDFGDAQSVARVMHYRVKTVLERTGIEVPERLAVGGREDHDVPLRLTYLERTPEPESLLSSSLVDDEMGSYARRLAVAMDERIAVLGERATTEPPEWALGILGSVPDDPVGRETWARRAGLVEAYREQYVDGERLENSTDPIGLAPSRFLSPDRYESWRLADDALGRPDRSRDVHRMPDRELRQKVQTWRRAEAAAPEHKGIELQSAREAMRRLERTHVRDMYGVVEPGPRLAAQGAELERMRAEVERLDAVQTMRDEWWAATDHDRTVARAAMGELQRRHPGLEETELLYPEEMTPMELRAYVRNLELRPVEHEPISLSISLL